MFKLLIVSAIAIGATCQSSFIETAGRYVAQKAVQNLRNEILKVSTPAQTDLKKATNNFKKIALQLEIESVNKLDKNLVPLQKQLNQLMEVAKEKGNDMKKCQKFVSDFKNVPKIFVQRSVACTDTLLSEVEKQANGLMSSTQLLVDYTIVIDKCNGDKREKDQCYIKLFEEINKEKEEVPKEIYEGVNEILKLIPTLVPKLQTCIEKNLAEANKTAENSISEFGLCAIME